MGQCSVAGLPTAMFLRGVRKPENQEKIHTDTGEHVKHSTVSKPSSVAERQQRYPQHLRLRGA